MCEYSRAFNKADKDGSGTLDYKEFHRILTRTGVTVNEKLVKKAFAALDADKDGVISFQEACLALRVCMQHRSNYLIMKHTACNNAKERNTVKFCIFIQYVKFPDINLMQFICSIHRYYKVDL